MLHSGSKTSEQWQHLQTMVATVASVCEIALKLWVRLGWGDTMCSLLAPSLYYMSHGNSCACVIILTNALS